MADRSRILISLVGMLALLNSSCALAGRSDQFLPARQMGIVRSQLTREISGIVASRQNAGVLWVHNDSDDTPRIFAINTQADLLGICNVAGATQRDWEDIAIGPGPDPNREYLYIGDIGDNLAQRPEVVIYRVPEPKISATAGFGMMPIGPAETIHLTYPGGPRDAETLLVDPLTRDIYIIAKREFFSKVYRAGFPQSTTGPTRMEAVTVLPWGFAVAGDVSPDGREVIVRGIFNASLWTRTAGEPLWHAFAGKQIRLPLASEPQGEAICFDSQGLGYFTISEGADPPLYYFSRAPEPSRAGRTQSHLTGRPELPLRVQPFVNSRFTGRR
ncbi:MAG: hypothetical protein JW955_16970 [Sedimentisphaerales bacterium]|nr:hypothetical protein [Sedimentisphaerales bacterium]